MNVHTWKLKLSLESSLREIDYLIIKSVSNILFYRSSFNCKKKLLNYHRVRKVHATHIMLDRGTTMMAFIQCTDLHAATARCQCCKPSQKSSQSSLFKYSLTVSIVSLSPLKFFSRTNLFKFDNQTEISGE